MVGLMGVGVGSARVGVGPELGGVTGASGGSMMVSIGWGASSAMRLEGPGVGSGGGCTLRGVTSKAPSCSRQEQSLLTQPGGRHVPAD